MNTPRTVRTVIGATLAWCAGIAGAICILITLAGLLGGYSLVLFRTGSMSPTIPTGSIALVHRIPAHEIRVGDVVTVQLPGHSPITHRVQSVARVSGTDDVERAVTLKGDANEQQDPRPFRVNEVKRVVASVPGGAQLLAAAMQPVPRGIGVLLAAGLVTWGLWPRRERPAAAAPTQNS